MRARMMWNVDVTTTTERQSRSRASRAMALASPRVLYGTAVKQTTRRARVPCVAQSRRACGQCFVCCDSREREHRGDSAPDQRQRGGRRFFLPESTTTASA